MFGPVLRGFAALLLATPALAGLPATPNNGRTPLPMESPWGFPIVISYPGSYVLTHDLVSAMPVAIRIEATDVTLDLDGKTLDAYGGTGIHLATGATATIRNGHIIDAGEGVFAVGLNSLVVEEIHFRNVGNAVRAESLESGIVRQVLVENSSGLAIRLESSGGSGQAVVTDIVVQDAGGIGVSGVGEVEISRNRLKQIHGGAIWVEFASGALIQENVISESANGSGIRVFGGVGHKAVGNLISNSTGAYAGIWWFGNSGQIVNNVVSGGADVGLDVAGDSNHIVGNTLNDNGSWGLRFQDSADDNVYRANVVRQNAGVAVDCNIFASSDFCDVLAGVTNNTSAGDNYAPNLF